MFQFTPPAYTAVILEGEYTIKLNNKYLNLTTVPIKGHPEVITLSDTPHPIHYNPNGVLSVKVNNVSYPLAYHTTADLLVAVFPNDINYPPDIFWPTPEQIFVVTDKKSTPQQGIYLQLSADKLHVSSAKDDSVHPFTIISTTNQTYINADVECGDDKACYKDWSTYNSTCAHRNCHHGENEQFDVSKGDGNLCPDGINHKKNCERRTYDLVNKPACCIGRLTDVNHCPPCWCVKSQTCRNEVQKYCESPDLVNPGNIRLWSEPTVCEQTCIDDPMWCLDAKQRYCGEPQTEDCMIDPTTLKPLTKCTRIHQQGKEGDKCRTWYADLVQKNQQDSVIQSICSGIYGEELPECRCANKSSDPIYEKMGQFQAMNDGCWWLPCKDSTSNLIPTAETKPKCPDNICQVVWNFVDDKTIDVDNVKSSIDCGFNTDKKFFSCQEQVSGNKICKPSVCPEVGDNCYKDTTCDSQCPAPTPPKETYRCNDAGQCELFKCDPIKDTNCFTGSNCGGACDPYMPHFECKADGHCQLSNCKIVDGITCFDDPGCLQQCTGGSGKISKITIISIILSIVGLLIIGLILWIILHNIRTKIINK